MWIFVTSTAINAYTRRLVQAIDFGHVSCYTESTGYLEFIEQEDFMMHKKENMKKAILTSMASAAKKAAQFNANNFCMWWQHDPKMPKTVKKLRKF